MICCDNGNNCMYTVLYSAEPGWALVIKEEIIHRIQIWRTAWSAPCMSHMKARLVSLRCFVLAMFPQKVLLCRQSSLLYSPVATSCSVSELHKKGHKSSTIRLLCSGKIMDQYNLFRQRKGVHDCCGNLSLFATFHIRRS